MDKHSVKPDTMYKITPKELQTARFMKGKCKDLLKGLKINVESIIDLKDAILEERPSREQLKNKQGRLLRYRLRIQKDFNKFLNDLKYMVESTSAINDPDMIRLKKIIIAEVDELSDAIEVILDILKDVGKKDFTKKLEIASSSVLKRENSIKDIIENQLFNHIDNDILGKMKISEIRNRMIKRAKYIKGLEKKYGVY